MCVMQPLRLTLTNLAEPLVLTVPNHPADPAFGSRELVMGSELFIDQADFREEANKPVSYTHLTLPTTPYV